MLLLTLLLGSPLGLEGVKVATNTGDVAAIERLKDVESELARINTRVTVLEYQTGRLVRLVDHAPDYRGLP